MGQADPRTIQSGATSRSGKIGKGERYRRIVKR
jgi:hypothetical protein